MNNVCKGCGYLIKDPSINICPICSIELQPSITYCQVMEENANLFVKRRVANIREKAKQNSPTVPKISNPKCNKVKQSIDIIINDVTNENWATEKVKMNIWNILKEIESSNL